MTQFTTDTAIMPQSIISAQQLTQKIQLAQKTLTIFENLNLEIRAGEQVAITGRSGSGKSTLLGILATLDQASAGQLTVCGESIQELNEEQRALVRLKYIGFVFQSFQLLPHLTALENVMLPLRLQPNFKFAEAEHKARNLLKKVGLERQAEQTPKVLSGGETTSGALARLPKLLQTHKPHVVVIELGGNDGLRGQPPQLIQNNLARLIQHSQQAKAKVIVFGMKMPPNYGSAYSKAFENNYKVVSQRYQVKLLPFFLDGVAGKNTLMQKDLIHPTAAAQPILLKNAYPFIQAALK